MTDELESSGIRPGNPVDEDRPQRPLSLAWISDELLAETRDVWSEVYGRPVDEAEAVEILMNAKRFAEVLIQAVKEMEAK
jgi:hypothetical protein